MLKRVTGQDVKRRLRYTDCSVTVLVQKTQSGYLVEYAYFIPEDSAARLELTEIKDLWFASIREMAEDIITVLQDIGFTPYLIFNTNSLDYSYDITIIKEGMILLPYPPKR